MAEPLTISGSTFVCVVSEPSATVGRPTINDHPSEMSCLFPSLFDLKGEEVGKMYSPMGDRTGREQDVQRFRQSCLLCAQIALIQMTDSPRPSHPPTPIHRERGGDGWMDDLLHNQ